MASECVVQAAFSFVLVFLDKEGNMRVLVVEDEPLLARQLSAALRRAGYAVDHAADGERADLLAHDERYDAVVLDLGLPKVDGLTLLRRWRDAQQTMPVLVLTARGSWHEKVQGIDGGADDYMAKPFRMEELLARLRALIRRSSGQSNPELRCGPLVLDPRSGKVTLEGAEVKLTSHEYRVLSYLMHQSQRVVSQSELTEHISRPNVPRRLRAPGCYPRLGSIRETRQPMAAPALKNTCFAKSIAAV
jgi:two-component system OmpR family response regulator